MDDLIKPRPKPKSGRVRSGAKLVRELLIIMFSALMLAVIVRIFFVQIFEIPSGSMQQTLEIGDRVAVQKVAQFQRGDVVVFKDKNMWLGAPPTDIGWVQKGLQFLGFVPDRSANYLIKRVIGVPGDHVKCCGKDGKIRVNGHPLEESSYLYKDVDGRPVDPSELEFDVVVPQGRIFVLGDHRNNSRDSRCYLDKGGDKAFIPLIEVQGEAFAVILPFNHLKKLSRPDTFAKVPKGGQPPATAKINEPIPHC